MPGAHCCRRRHQQGEQLRVYTDLLGLGCRPHRYCRHAASGWGCAHTAARSTTIDQPSMQVQPARGPRMSTSTLNLRDSAQGCGCHCQVRPGFLGPLLRSYSYRLPAGHGASQLLVLPVVACACCSPRVGSADMPGPTPEGGMTKPRELAGFLLGQQKEGMRAAAMSTEPWPIFI